MYIIFYYLFILLKKFKILFIIVIVYIVIYDNTTVFKVGAGVVVGIAVEHKGTYWVITDSISSLTMSVAEMYSFFHKIA